MRRNMNRAEIHSRFVETFASDYHERSIPEVADLLKVEKALGTTFPQSYVDFITTHGSVLTPSLLDLVTGGESEEAPEGASFDIREFIAAEEVGDAAEAYWSGGMDEAVVPIASDCMENVFGFSKSVLEKRPDDLPVMVFDHDFVTVGEEHSSFDGWLNSFLTMHRLTQAEQD